MTDLIEPETVAQPQIRHERGSLGDAAPLNESGLLNEPATPAQPRSQARPSTRDLAPVKAVADNFVQLMRAFQRGKARLMHSTEHDVEWSSHFILRFLKNEGPMRAGAIAGCMQTDPSTVSRQVAALVKDGFLERRADPADGRASLLVLTPAADAVLDEHDRIRTEYFGHIVQDWSDEDVTQLGALLDRFTQAYEAVDDNWFKDRLTSRPAQATGSTD